MADTRTIDFNRLPKAVRQRLINGIARQDTPMPVLADPASTAGAVGWGLLAIVCAGTVFGLASSGFATPYDSNSVQGPITLAVYAAAIFGGVYSVLAIIRGSKLRASLPFKPGRYLFPMDFVDARSRTLRIIPMNTLADFSAVHHHTNGVYTHTLFTLTFENRATESFTARTKVEAESSLQALKTARASIAQAVQDRNIDVIANMDPFFEIRIADAWDNPPPDKGFDVGPVAGEIPAWLKQALVVAVAPALFLGPLFWYVRNRLSDDTMFKRAVAENTESGFERYLYHGQRHAEEVRQDLIWKAALEDAKKKGTSEALDAFRHKYPDSPVTKEVETELLPRLALKEAVAKGTVSAIREFLKLYPGSVVDADAHTEIHKLFASTLTAFRAQASTADPKMLPFVERLIAYMEEKESPPLLVTFRGSRSPSLELADQLLKKQANGLDVPGVPGLLGPSLAAVSPHFSDERSEPREAAIVTILQGAFATIFPADVLALKQGPRRLVESKDESVTEPSIEIDYQVSWSGSTYSSESNGREFVGIKFDFQAAMRLPKESDKEALRFKLNVAPPDHFTVNYFTSSSPFLDQKILGKDGPTDEKVYEVMAARAFDELSVKLRGVFFKEGSEALANKPVEKPAVEKVTDPSDGSDGDED